MAHKDLAIATELGRRNQVPMPPATIVEQQLIEAMARGLSDKGAAASFKMREQRAAIKVRAR
jgi:3-hydroxyisobutyrate dehydrogenase-like beta-hydroxyacid dehydrogenase